MARRKGQKATEREKAWQRVYNRKRKGGEINPHISHDEIMEELGFDVDIEDRIPDDGRHCQRCGDLSLVDPCSVCEYELRKDAIRKSDTPKSA